MANTWFCKCGKINLASNNKCESCGGFRWVTEKKENPGIKEASKKPK